MVELGTVRGMVRLRFFGSGIWRALGVGGGGWKVILQGFCRDLQVGFSFRFEWFIDRKLGQFSVWVSVLVVRRGVFLGRVFWGFSLFSFLLLGCRFRVRRGNIMQFFLELGSVGRSYVRFSCRRLFFLYMYTGLVFWGGGGFFSFGEVFMGIRIFLGSGEKLRSFSGFTRQDLGFSFSFRDRRDSVFVMVDGL